MRPALKPFVLLATLFAVAPAVPETASRAGGAPSLADAVRLALPTATLHAQDQPVVLDSAFLAGYSWRNLGPDRGGRSIAVSGVKGRPQEAYFGATGGGLWKTVDGGENWFPVTDFQINSASVGAVAVAETDPDLVFIGTGETCIRGNILPGDGVYRSRDAGETWEHVGFADSDGISKIRIHPTDPDIIYVASFGKYGVPSEERGVFRSTDGGDSWTRILFRDERTGAIDIALDRNNPDVLYAALWEAFRKEYTMSSGGPGSGMFKSVDGGMTWTEMTRNPGMPPEGVVGKIGLAVSSSNSERVYALFEHDDGGLFRSDDGGESWELVNGERRIRQRAFYYTHVFADHHDEDVVYVQNTSFFRSTDGGANYEVINNGTHIDFHDFWIDPDDPAHVVVANDGGGAVSFTTGSEWTDQEFSTAQFYHGVTTAHIPFHICGSQQDNSTLCLPSDWNAGRFASALADTAGDSGARVPDITAGSMDVFYRAGGGEPGYIAPDPKDLDVFFSGTNNGRYIDRFNRRLGTSREVNPYPWFYSGEPAIDMVERWQWTFPIIFSPIDPNVLYASSNRLWRTTDGGTNWEALSPDLTRADPMTLGHSGGPITGDMNGPEVYATIFAVGPGKVDIDVIWTGSDDGLVYVTRDGGANWTDVTPSDMPDFGRVSLIDASAFGAGRAYVSARRALLDDFRPHIWKTDDFGETWTRIVDGIRDDAYVNSIREDPNRAGLLYAGTNHGVYISYDDGGSWQELNPDLPRHSDHGRDPGARRAGDGEPRAWLLDPRQRRAAAAVDARNDRPGTWCCFDPAAAYRSANGVVLSWWLGDEPGEAMLEIVDASGDVVRTFEPAVEGEERDRWAGPGSADGSRAEPPALGSPHRPRRVLRGDDPLGRRHHGARGPARNLHGAPDRGRPRGNRRGGGEAASVDHRRDGRGPGRPVRVRRRDPRPRACGQLRRDRHSGRESPTGRPLGGVGRRAPGRSGRAAAGGGLGGGSGHLPGAQQVQPGPPQLPDQGEQPPGQPALDVGAGGWAAGERHVRGVRDHGGEAGGAPGAAAGGVGRGVGGGERGVEGDGVGGDQLGGGGEGGGVVAKRDLANPDVT